MTEEEYQSRMEELSADIGVAMSSISTLSAKDKSSCREGIGVIRTMTVSFREFTAISDPPEAWAEAHHKIAASRNRFADPLEEPCGRAEFFGSSQL